MKMRNVLYVVTLIAGFQLFFFANAYSQPSPLTAKELIEHSFLKEHAKALDDGEIVMMKQPERERPNQLNVLMLVLVPAQMKKVEAMDDMV